MWVLKRLRRIPQSYETIYSLGCITVMPGDDMETRVESFASILLYFFDSRLLSIKVLARAERRKLCWLKLMWHSPLTVGKGESTSEQRQ